MKTLSYFRAGCTAIVLGLNILIVWYALNINKHLTRGMPDNNSLGYIGAAAIYVGLGILVIGLALSHIKIARPEVDIIKTAGAQIAALGILAILRATGFNDTNSIYRGAWAAVVIGLILIGIHIVQVIKQKA